MKYKEGDIVLVPAKIEQIETYGDEATFFLSSDIWDGFGEAEEKDLVPYEKLKISSEISEKAEENGENRQKAVKNGENRQKAAEKTSERRQDTKRQQATGKVKAKKRQQDEPISLSAYGRQLAKELARDQELINK